MNNFLIICLMQLISCLSPNGTKILRIGVSISVSELDPYYADAVNAIYLRTQQFNNRRDLIDDNTKLELYNLENFQQQAEVLKNGVVFTKSDVLAIIGTGWSSLTDLLLLVTRNSQIPVCDGGSTSPMLSNKLKYPNFFRTVPQDSAQAVAIVGFIKSNGWKKISIIYSNEPYGLGLATQTETECAKNGI
ncbi:periplasmic binding protein-like I, partial [Globomyces pollinis-pini]